MEVTVASDNATSLAPAPHCWPWEDNIETHKENHLNSLVGSVLAITTIFANILLFVIIFSNKDFKDQVRIMDHPLKTDIFNFDQRCNMFMLSIGCSDVLSALNGLVFSQPGFIRGR